MNRWLIRLLAGIQHRCKHPSDFVTADIHEGQFEDYKGIGTSLNWCQICGAYRFRYRKNEDDPVLSMWRCPNNKWHWPKGGEGKTAG